VYYRNYLIIYSKIVACAVDALVYSVCFLQFYLLHANAGPDVPSHISNWQSHSTSCKQCSSENDVRMFERKDGGYLNKILLKWPMVLVVKATVTEIYKNYLIRRFIMVLTRSSCWIWSKNSRFLAIKTLLQLCLLMHQGLFYFPFSNKGCSGLMYFWLLVCVLRDHYLSGNYIPFVATLINFPASLHRVLCICLIWLTQLKSVISLYDCKRLICTIGKQFFERWEQNCLHTASIWKWNLCLSSETACCTR
jgi:hypothetical protein